MHFADRHPGLSALLAALVAASALVMLLVHGHAPVSATHLHVTTAEEGPQAATATDSTTVSFPATTDSDGGIGPGTWAVRDGVGFDLTLGLLLLAGLELIRRRRGTTTGSGTTPWLAMSVGGRRRPPSDTPIRRHEVLQV